MKKTNFWLLSGLFALAAFLTAFTVRELNRDPEVTFQHFLKQFPKEKLPFSFDEKELRANLDAFVAYTNEGTQSRALEKHDRLDWKYYKFLPGLDMQSRFSRMPMYAEPVARLASGNNIAVIYASGHSRQLVYQHYVVTVFTKDGQFVSQNDLGSIGTKIANTFSIDHELNATLNTWDINWEKDYDISGINGNRIVGLTQTDAKALDLKVPTSLPVRFKKEMLAPTPVEKPSVPGENTRTR